MHKYLRSKYTKIKQREDMRMERSDDERLLDLRALVRTRLERDLTALATISKEKPELSLRDILDEVLHVFINYLEQDTLLNSAASKRRKDNPKIEEELRKLKSIDT